MLDSPISPTTSDKRTFGFADRLLADAVRLHEESLGAPLEEPDAEAAARAGPGDFESRVVNRARHLSVAQPLQAALQHLWAGVLAAFTLGLVVALATGGAAARVVLGSYDQGPVNFFLTLTALLGLHTLVLLVWLIFIVFRPGSAVIGLLGGLVVRVGARLSRSLHKGPLELAAIRAAAGIVFSAGFGRWALSTISHCMWLAYLAGCLIVLVLLLSTRQYDFAWETTILSEPAYVEMARLIALPVEAIGFAVPDAAQIGASRWTGPGMVLAEAREAWGSLLIGCIVVYGLLPRCGALLATVTALLRARSKYRLDPGHVGFVRLRGRLMPLARQTGIVDPQEPDSEGDTALPVIATGPIGVTGPAGIIGLEVDRPASGWPPDVPLIEWWDLGFADNRADRQRILREVSAAEGAPRALLVVCSLAATPDRGTRAFIDALRRASASPPVLLLTEGQRLRGRAPPEQVEQRIEDWRRLARDAGIADDRVLDLDLDHLTDASRHRLTRLLRYGGQDARRPRLIEQAFTLILDHAKSWSGTPSIAQQAELQRAIAKLHGSGRQAWREMLKVRLSGATPGLGELRESSRRMVDLLPARLRNTRWLAAGAVAGALGCVAAATMVAPAAIVALPAWAGVGAALSALIGPSASVKQTTAGEPLQLTDAVNAAALFAIVLELQGRDETEITRIIDAVAGKDEPPAMHDLDSVRAWLDALRSRLDSALEAEQRAGR